MLLDWIGLGGNRGKLGRGRAGIGLRWDQQLKCSIKIVPLSTVCYNIKNVSCRQTQ